MDKLFTGFLRGPLKSNRRIRLLLFTFCLTTPLMQGQAMQQDVDPRYSLVYYEQSSVASYFNQIDFGEFVNSLSSAGSTYFFTYCSKSSDDFCTYSSMAVVGEEGPFNTTPPIALAKKYRLLWKHHVRRALGNVSNAEIDLYLFADQDYFDSRVEGASDFETIALSLAEELLSINGMRKVNIYFPNAVNYESPTDQISIYDSYKIK